MAFAISSKRVLFTANCFLFATGKVSSTEINPHDISNSTRKGYSTTDAVEYHHKHPQLAGYGTNILAAGASTAVQQLKTYFSLFCSPGEQIRMEVAKFVLF
jgi:hypothetical protein